MARLWLDCGARGGGRGGRRVAGHLLREVPEGRATRVDQGHLMLEYFIASQSEVIRAIVSDYRPCCGPDLDRTMLISHRFRCL